MNKTIAISGSLLALSILIVGGLSYAYAHSGGFGGNFGSLEKKAEFLGLTEGELQTKLDGGQNFREIAEESGLTKENFHSAKMGKHLEKIAELLDTTVEDLEALKDEGKTWSGILEAAELTQEEFLAIAKAEHIAKVQGRVQSGDLTQEEADNIIERIENYEGGHGFSKEFHKGKFRFAGHKYFK